ncbi:MAG: T9SS type A sorting domain-containing protein, partial [Bacteroidia bacterium]|nr:T9SS type A sorting domain-containing protein [Bacteroidia bacterium]
ATTGTAVPASWTNTTAATDGGFISGNPTGTYPAGLTSSSMPFPALPGSTRSVGTNDDGCNCTKANELLASPVINCTGQSTVFLSFDCLYYEGTYSGASETFKVKYSTNGGTTWTDIATISGAAGWTNLVYDISAQVGNQANVKIGFWYDDGAGWLFGAGLDNFKVYAPAALDMAANTIVMNAYTANLVANPVTGVMTNMGASTITSMNLNYKVDGGGAVTQALSSLSIAPLTTYTYNHGTPWTPSATGNHTIKVWASNINGGADGNNSNDTVTYVTYTCSQVAQRMVLYESFSSSTCAPCASANPGLHTLMLANNYNTAGGKVAVVKYQMNYPSPGNDPAYTTANNTRHSTFYGIGGIPQGEMDGGLPFEGHPANLTQQIIDDEYAVPAPVNITATAVYAANVVTVSGSVAAYANINGASVLIAVTEKHINTADAAHGTQSNGETDWYDVNRKFAGTGGVNGNALGNMVDGTSYPFNHTATFTGYTGPGTGTAGTSGNKIFTNIGAMTAIVWVQDLATKAVYQSTIADVVTAVNDKESALSTLDLYPNPSNDLTNLNFTLKNNTPVVINVYNMLGEVVYTQNMGTLQAGMNKVNFSAANFAGGMYNVVITAGSSNTSTKFFVQK